MLHFNNNISQTRAIDSFWPVENKEKVELHIKSYIRSILDNIHVCNQIFQYLGLMTDAFCS